MRPRTASAAPRSDNPSINCRTVARAARATLAVRSGTTQAEKGGSDMNASQKRSRILHRTSIRRVLPVNRLVSEYAAPSQGDGLEIIAHIFSLSDQAFRPTTVAPEPGT